MQRLEAELDELWSFVGKKANRQWGWSAMNATTHHVMAFHVGDRSGQSAQALWKKIPSVYQNHVVFYGMLRQRVARLVRATLSFSKTLTHHIGAIKYFICGYNLTKCAALPQ